MTKAIRGAVQTQAALAASLAPTQAPGCANAGTEEAAMRPASQRLPAHLRVPDSVAAQPPSAPLSVAHENALLQQALRASMAAEPRGGGGRGAPCCCSTSAESLAPARSHDARPQTLAEEAEMLRLAIVASEADAAAAAAHDGSASVAGAVAAAAASPRGGAATTARALPSGRRGSGGGGAADQIASLLQAPLVQDAMSLVSSLRRDLQASFTELGTSVLNASSSAFDAAEAACARRATASPATASDGSLTAVGVESGPRLPEGTVSTAGHDAHAAPVPATAASAACAGEAIAAVGPGPRSDGGGTQRDAPTGACAAQFVAVAGDSADVLACPLIAPPVAAAACATPARPVDAGVASLQPGSPPPRRLRRTFATAVIEAREGRGDRVGDAASGNLAASAVMGVLVVQPDSSPCIGWLEAHPAVVRAPPAHAPSSASGPACFSGLVAVACTEAALKSRQWHAQKRAVCAGVPERQRAPEARDAELYARA